MNGKIEILDSNDIIHCVKIGQCKYIIVYSYNGGAAIYHANDCEHCFPNKTPKKMIKEPNAHSIPKRTFGLCDDSEMG